MSVELPYLRCSNCNAKLECTLCTECALVDEAILSQYSLEEICDRHYGDGVADGRMSERKDTLAWMRDRHEMLTRSAARLRSELESVRSLHSLPGGYRQLAVDRDAFGLLERQSELLEAKAMLVDSIVRQLEAGNHVGWVR